MLFSPFPSNPNLCINPLVILSIYSQFHILKKSSKVLSKPNNILKFMDRSVTFPCLIPILIFACIVLAMPVVGQTSRACTGAMLSSFGNCIGFLASRSNASSPTSDCCSSLKSLMSNGQDCLCLIVTGGVPFQVPINRTLAISLPRACRMSGVPVECKGDST